MITLDDIIKEGQEIRKCLNKSDFGYYLHDTQVYGAWKNKAIRFLDITFPGNRCIKDFEKSIDLFEQWYHTPSYLDDALGVLISCHEMMPTVKTNSYKSTEYQNILALESTYEQSVSGDSMNKSNAISAFHNWYDSLVRYLSRYFDETNSNYKQIMSIDTSGNGYTLYHEYQYIRAKAHILLDNLNNDEISGCTQKNPSTTKVKSNKIFIVHGHDNEMKESVARLLEKLGLKPIILNEQVDKSRTIIEKFEEESDVDYAIVLMSDRDDHGCEISSMDLRPRARQNVILELGYFMGKLGRKGHVCVLKKENVEKPSDTLGILYQPYDSGTDSWKYKVAQELKAAGYDVDMNTI